MTQLLGNEKLLAARAEIEALCKRHDIACVCVLHMPGYVEVYSDLTPSYSRLEVLARDEHTMAIRLRSKLEDYNGDADAQRRDLEATANMVRHLSEALGNNALYLLELAARIDRQTNAEHSPMRPVHRDKGRTQ